MKKAKPDAKPEIVTPFDWKRYTASEGVSPAADPSRQAPPRRAKALTARDRVERILAHRWGNPYCKPGAA